MRFFESNYDGTSYHQLYRLDPRMLVPGIMLTIFSVPLVIWTWPVLTTFAVTGIGLGLVGLAFATQHRFVVSPDGYRLSRRIDPLGWTVHFASNEGTPFLVPGRHGTCMVKVRRGRRVLDPWIEAASQPQGQAWLQFLQSVSHAQPARIPDQDDAWVLPKHR